MSATCGFSTSGVAINLRHPGVARSVRRGGYLLQNKRCGITHKLTIKTDSLSRRMEMCWRISSERIQKSAGRRSEWFPGNFTGSFNCSLAFDIEADSEPIGRRRTTPHRESRFTTTRMLHSLNRHRQANVHSLHLRQCHALFPELAL